MPTVNASPRLAEWQLLVEVHHLQLAAAALCINCASAQCTVHQHNCTGNSSGSCSSSTTPSLAQYPR